VGTVFALCEESALREDYKRAILASVVAGEAQVFTDPLASPTGFPFKVVVLPGTMAVAADYAVRPRICDLGYLREAYRMPSGAIGYRCAAEPVATYIAKGGNVEKTTDRKCLCNALLANVGQSQIQPSSYVETGLVTCGNSLADLASFLSNGNTSYTAADVIAKLLGTHA